MKSRYLFLIIFLFLSGIVATFALLTMGTSAAPLGDPTWPTPTPAPIPPDVPFVPVPDVEAAALPDLVITDIRIEPSTAIANAEAIVYVTVRNAGTANMGSTNNFYVDLYVDTDPYSGLRGIISSISGAVYPWGYAYSTPMTVPFGCQGFWFPLGASVELSTTLIFTKPANYNLYARVDLPECQYGTAGCPCVGNVCEDDEDNNVYPSPSQPPEEIIVVAPDRIVERDHVNYMSEYASSLEELPISGTLGIPLTSGTEGGDSALVLGLFEEPPYWHIPNTAAPLDYDVLSPDKNVNKAISCDQVAPIIATDGLSTTNNLVIVWEDWHNNDCQDADIYLNWATDAAATWQAVDIRVNSDAAAWPNWYQIHPAVAVSSKGDVVVVWQDNRNGNYDIYFQHYNLAGAVLTAVGGNQQFTMANPAYQIYDQIHPDIAVTGEGVFYLAWEDKRNNNSDIFAARGQVVGGVLVWDTDTMISDDPGTSQQVFPSINAQDTWLANVAPDCPTYDDETHTIEMIVSYFIGPSPSVACVWQDFRNGAADPDVYLNVAYPVLTPFGNDRRVNDDVAGAMQAEPAVDVGQMMKSIVFHVTRDDCPLHIPPGVTAYSDPEPVPVTLIHTVWQDYRNSTNAGKDNDPDIYYYWESIEPRNTSPYDLVIGQASGGLDGSSGNYRVNSNDLRAWQTGPPWQGHPEIRVKSYEKSLPPELDIASDIYLVWADGRNYDNRNYDIYMQFDDDPFVEENQMGDYLVKNNHVVNDNVKIHDYDPVYFPDYSKSSPPSAKQWRPSVATNLEHKGNVVVANTYAYVAWDDQRASPPGVHRDVFFSRSNLTFFANWLLFDYNYPGYGWLDGYYGAGSYLSSVYDSGSTETTWYSVWWDAETPEGTYISVQTRVADTVASVLSANWYPERLAYPNKDVPDPKPYIPLQGHNAPGQYIEGPGDQKWPTGRYIQYRVNFWTTINVHTPIIYDVSLFYTRGGGVAGHQIYYLPLIVKDFRCAGITPNDPDYPKQWDMWHINADCAWALRVKTPVAVAVVDSGVDYYSHPDLGHFLSGYDFHDWDSQPLDKCGHGTHVAGTIGAAVANNRKGVVGVYWEPQIMPMKITGDNCGTFPSSVVAAAVGQAADWQARVINLSLGGYGFSNAEYEAVMYARYTRGALVVAAAGNDATDQASYPAAFPGVLAVSATNVNGERAGYSNFGSYIDVAAPGGEMAALHDPGGIYSTLPSYYFELAGSGYDYNYDYLQGTSMACPHVSGLAALIWGLNPGLRVDQVEYLIAATAWDIGAPGWDQYYGYGMIDVYRAAIVADTYRATAQAVPAETPPPVPRAVIDPSIDHVPGRVLVKFKSQVQAAEVDNLLAAHSATVSHQIEPIDVLVLEVPQGQEVEVATALNDDPSVQYAELDYLRYLY